MDVTVFDKNYHDPPRYGRFFALLACWAGSLLLGQPSRAELAETGRLVETLRLIDREPTALGPDPSQVLEETVQSWDLTDATEAAAWTVTGGTAQLGDDPRDFTLTTEGDDVQMRRRVDLDAHEISAFRVWLHPPLRHFDRAQLFWSPEGGDDTARRSAECERPDPAVEYCEVELAAHAAWTGSIRSLRLDPTVFPDITLGVSRIEAIRRRPTGQASADAPTARKVTVVDDSRWSLVAAPGEAILRDVDVPPHAVFRVHWALRLAPGASRPTGKEAARVQIDIVDAEGEHHPGAVQAVAWRPSMRWESLRVDLAAFAGQRVRIELQALGPVGADEPPPLVPAWANPEVLQLPPGKSRPPNVILISIDTLRPDHMSLYGHERETTPRIDRWAREHGVVFERAFAPAPWTLPSHTSMLTGLDAIRHGVNHARAAPEALRFLAEDLREAGYATAAFTGGGFLAPSYGLDQGFEIFRAWRDGPEHQERELGTGIGEAVRLLEELEDRPVFLFLHTYLVHAPFRRHEPYWTLLDPGATAPRERSATGRDRPITPETEMQRVWDPMWMLPDGSLEIAAAEDLDSIRHLYDSGIALTDDWIGRFLEQLSASEAGRDSLVILTSDHGELFGEHDSFGHLALETENLRVPLVIAPPEQATMASPWRVGERVDSLVRLVDLVPTVLDLLDLEAATSLDGESLLPLLEGRNSEAERSNLAYAANTNFGISLRRHDGLDVRFNNTAFAPHAGEQQVSGAREHTTATEIDALRETMLARLHTRDGLRLRLQNLSTNRTLKADLWGPELRASRIKTTDFSCPCLRYVGTERSAIHMPPGSSLELVIESVGRAAVTLTGGVSRAGSDEQHDRFEWRAWPLDRDASDAPRRLDVSRDGQITIEAYWHGTRESISAAVEATEPDLELEDQLRALGYLD